MFLDDDSQGNWPQSPGDLITSSCLVSHCCCINVAIFHSKSDTAAKLFHKVHLGTLLVIKFLTHLKG